MGPPDPKVHRVRGAVAQSHCAAAARPAARAAHRQTSSRLLAETVVTNQYADSAALARASFRPRLPGAGGDGFRPVVKSAPVGEAASGTHVADIKSAYSSRLHAAAFEFYPAVTTATFESPKTEVSVRVGLDGPPRSCPGFDQPDCADVTLQAYDANGDPVGSPSSRRGRGGRRLQDSPLGHDADGCDPRLQGQRAQGDDANEAVRIDDVTFEHVGHAAAA